VGGQPRHRRCGRGGRRDRTVPAAAVICGTDARYGTGISASWKPLAGGVSLSTSPDPRGAGRTLGGHAETRRVLTARSAPSMRWRPAHRLGPDMAVSDVAGRLRKSLGRCELRRRTAVRRAHQ
jgi:hypothetical protein